MFRKMVSGLLIMMLIAGLLPAWGEVASAATTADYLNTDTQTQGDWNGRYGADGYVLPFFTTTRTTNGRDDPLADDLAQLPDYVDSYSKSGSVTYWVIGNANDSRALRTPDGSGRKKLEVYSGGNFTYTFNLNDDQPHIFTIYATDYGLQPATLNQRYEILNMSNQVVASREVSQIQDGKYISFEVQGSFKLRGTKISDRVYAQGFFFDEPVQITASNLELTPLAGRMVGLQWDDTVTSSTAILRRAQGEADFVKIAETNEGVNTFTDTDLVPGVQYEYALQNRVGYRYSQPTPAVSVTVPLYGETALTLTEAVYTIAAPGQVVTLAASFRDADNEPLEGHAVTFTLQGDHVGTYISPEIGQAATDEHGIASLDYSLPYAGSYTILVSVPPDDASMLNGAETSATLVVEGSVTQWSQSPLLWRASDAVKPGMLFQVSGHALIADDWEDVRAVADPLAGAGAQPSVQAVELEIVQRDEDRGQFLQLLFPEELAGGSYRLWVSNEHGWSEPFPLNTPRPLFISEYEVFEGLFIDLSGRNLLAEEFGATAATRVRLAAGAGVYHEVQITDLTPYSLRFIVEGVPLGEYEVEVSNDAGLSWHGLYSGQSLTVIPEGNDPLGMGVAWADNFRWDQVFDITDYGAVPNDGEDDTAAIASAIAAAKSAGGGVVYLPAGEFHATVVQLPSRIVLMGDGPEESLLYHIGGNQNFVQAIGDGKSEGQLGLARLGLRAADTTMYPDAFIWFGQDWGTAVNDMHLRTAREIFAIEISIDYPVLTPPAAGSGRAQGMLVIADERFLFKNNRASGWSAQYTRVYMNEYVYSSDNYVEYSYSQMPITADYTFVRDNEFVLRGEADIEIHGISIKSNSHVENNIVRTTGAEQKTTYHNDGESIFAEMPGAWLGTGEVLGATPGTITLAPKAALPDPILIRNGRLSVVIIDGTGLGQYRHVQLQSGTTYTVEQPWDVVPDTTSKFALIVPNENVTIYRNNTTGGQRGIWLYGNTIDAVVADNQLANTDGIYVTATAVVNSNRFTPTYFVAVKGNRLLGTPGEGHASGIIALSQRNGVNGRYYASGLYGIEIRDNYLYGSQEPISTPRHNKVSGIVSSAATLSSDSNPVFEPEDRDNLNVLIANNRLENMADGLVMMSGLYGNTASGNQFIDVLNELREHYGPGTSRLLQLPAGFKDERAPYWPAFSALQAELNTSGTAQLTWDAAEDSVGVALYRIYANNAIMAEVSGNTVSYETAQLTSGMAYTFRVGALDAAGNESYTLLEAQVTTPTAPGSNPSGGGPGFIAVVQDTQAEAQQDGSVAVSLKPVVNGSNRPTAQVSKEQLERWLDMTRPEPGQDRVIRLQLQEVQDADGYAMELPAGSGCGDKGAYRLQVMTALATVEVPCEALQSQLHDGANKVQLVIRTADAGKRAAVAIDLSAGGSTGDLADAIKFVVKLPYEPTDQEAKLPSGIIVVRADGDQAGQIMLSGKYNDGQVTFKSGGSGAYAIDFVEVGFEDVQRLAWAKAEIDYLTARGIIHGMSTSAFHPLSSIKRADVVVLLARTFELRGTPEAAFDDVSSEAYYFQAVGLAHAAGIVKGSAGNRFAPEQSVSRQDLMVMLARALDQAGVLSAVQNSGAVLASFADNKEVAVYARDSVAALIELGVIQGSSGRLNPLQSTNRAEAAVMIYRILELL